MTSIFHAGLTKDFSLILNDADDFNVIIQVGENENTKEFRAHSVILRARSPYFKSALSTNWVRTENNMIIFNKPNITPTVFDMILKYIYTGELDLTKQSGENILELLIASDELLLEELFKHVQDYLINNKQSSWVQQNYILIIKRAFKLESCKKLQNYCLENISKDPQPFITSATFPSLDKNILFGLFKHDDFYQIKEVVAWDILIKWGIKQTPGLEDKNDQNEWTDKDYEDLKNTLSDFIPLINFLKFTSTDFHHKVRPYKAIIPNNVYEEVMTFYLVELPKLYILSMPQIDSNIIEPKLANIVANWIDKKNLDTKYNSLYKFCLIYRGSRDGIDVNSFKSKCKGQVASLVLIKVQGSDKIFGGYSSVGLNSIGDNFEIHDGYRFYYSSDNFIFSFENREDTQNIKISRVVNKSEAILEVQHNGFNFGRGSLFMRDHKIIINNRLNRNYENNFGERLEYAIEEIETFIVVKQ